MTTLVLGNVAYQEAPQDEGDVRSTVTVIDHNSPDAVAEASPEYNTVERDPDTEGGLTARGVADKVNPSERFSRLPGNANTDFSAPVDSRISTSGTAAMREDSGAWGHGSMHYQESLEPTIREGGNFDDVYFSARRPPIQDGTLDYMVPSRTPDDSTAEGVARAAAIAQRKAIQAAAYQRFLDDRTR